MSVLHVCARDPFLYYHHHLLLLLQHHPSTSTTTTTSLSPCPTIPSTPSLCSNKKNCTRKGKRNHPLLKNFTRCSFTRRENLHGDPSASESLFSPLCTLPFPPSHHTPGPTQLSIFLLLRVSPFKGLSRLLRERAERPHLFPAQECSVPLTERQECRGRN